MFTIKIVKLDDQIITKINGTPAEIAENYFHDQEVVSIEYLDGEYEAAGYITIPILIERIPEAFCKEYGLYYNIRYEHMILRKDGTFKKISCGIARV